MMWDSFASFLNMGGYALYVWGSFGVCAFCLILEPILIRRQYQATIMRLKRLKEVANS